MTLNNILVVEDSPSWRELLRDILETDYKVEDVSNAEEAKTRLERQPFGLVIANLQLGTLPGVADQLGLLVIEELQKLNPGTPCIILTGSVWERREQLKNYCNLRYDADIWVMSKGTDNLYAELQNRVKNIFGRYN